MHDATDPAVPPPLLHDEIATAQPPRVLVQWLPTDRLRRKTRLQSGSTGQVGDVRQVGVNHDHPLYARAAAMATIPHAGPHAGRLLLLVGFRGQAMLTEGGWSLCGAEPKAPAGCDAVYRFGAEPSFEELINVATVEWLNENPGEAGARLLEDLTEDAQDAVDQYNEAREALVAKQIERQKHSPLANRDAFDRVAGSVEVVADLRLDQVEPFAAEVVAAVRADPSKLREGAHALDQVLRAAVSWDAAEPALVALIELEALPLLGYGADGARYAEERRRLWSES